MIYIVNYMYVYDDYKDAGASTSILGVFSEEEAAYKCAIQKYCEEIQERSAYRMGDLKEELEVRLLGNPKDVYASLHSWRDELYTPEFTRDSVGPMVFVESQRLQKDWGLDKFLTKTGLKPGGRLQRALEGLSKTKTGKLGKEGVEELWEHALEAWELSLEDGQKIVEKAGLTSSAKKRWEGYLNDLEKEEEARRKKEREEEEARKKAELERREKERQEEEARAKAREREDNLKKLKIKSEDVDGVSFESVLLPSGSFMMGAKERDSEADDDERPRHEVELSSGFWMMSTAVTQDLYEVLMGNNPSEFKEGRRPVECVSWFDAVECANELSRRQGLKEVYTIDGEDVEADWSANGWRLPTEAEWEYAARAGTDFKYAGSNDLDEVGWDDYNSGRETHRVGKKKPNGWGLYDMSGNVEEWCWDWYGDYPSSKQTDPKGPKTGSNRVCRGGSWDVVARGARVSIRLYCDPSDRSIYLGFRFSRSSL